MLGGEGDFAASFALRRDTFGGAEFFAFASKEGEKSLLLLIFIIGKVIDHKIRIGSKAQIGEADFDFAVGLDLLFVTVENGNVQKADVFDIDPLLYQSSPVRSGFRFGKLTNGNITLCRQHAFFGADGDSDAAVSGIIDGLRREVFCRSIRCFDIGSRSFGFGFRSGLFGRLFSLVRSCRFLRSLLFLDISSRRIVDNALLQYGFVWDAVISIIQRTGRENRVGYHAQAYAQKCQQCDGCPSERSILRSLLHDVVPPLRLFYIKKKKGKTSLHLWQRAHISAKKQGRTRWTTRWSSVNLLRFKAQQLI